LICPSILSADFSRLKEILWEMEKQGIQTVHFDVMDNHFVPNLTFGHKFIEDLRPHSKLFFDAHLMIDSPENYLDLYLNAGADLITVHYEATTHEHIMQMSQKVRAQGKKFGVSLKPGTSPTVLNELGDELDLILIMSVEPGFGGQQMISSCIDKIAQCKSFFAGKSILVQVDGGINQENIQDVIRQGVDWIVIGSAFFKQKDYGFFLKYLSPKN
jgi:ribulose-phosphate 3-epimerase